MMEQMNNITNKLIELFLMIIWWTCLWSLCKVIMVIFMLKILHAMVTVLSNFLHLHILINQTWLLMVKLFLPVKWYMKEPIFKININSNDYVLQKYKPNDTIVSTRTIIKSNINVICYDSKDIFPPRARSIPHND